ncbi:MAG TPA: hypothetical protein VMW48_05220 [Vicinamibacterales bacterium]|nr:hypothetical protein [Vicinamibacterales bacterium]
MKAPQHNDQFVYEEFESLVRGLEGKQTICEWNYRDRAGVLWAGIAISKAEAVAKAAEHGYLDDVVEAGELARQVERDVARTGALNDLANAVKRAAAAGAVVQDLESALRAGGASVSLQRIAEGATKAQSQVAIAVHTKPDVNGNTRHGFLLFAPLLAPLPAGHTGHFFIESPGDNTADLFACAPDVQWPAWDLLIGRGDFRRYAKDWPAPPRVATKASQVVFKSQD